MNRTELLRSKRKDLVLAAKAVMEEAFRDSAPGLNKAQLSYFISVCNEAACAEEIELYIRYQASRERSEGNGHGRGRGVWEQALADRVIERARAAMASLSGDELKVDAWRLYAVFLTREFTYQNAAHRREPVDARREAGPRDGRRDARGRGGRQ